MKTIISALATLSVVSGIAAPAIAADTKSSHEQRDRQLSAANADGDVFRAAPSSLLLTEKQRIMLQLAKGSEATTGVKIMAAPIASALEQALTKEASAASKTAAQITLALTDKTILTATRTSVDVKSGVGVWRGTIDATGGDSACWSPTPRAVPWCPTAASTHWCP